MKTTHLCWRRAFVCAIWAILVTTGCQKAEVNFSINGRDDTLPITEMPTDPNDTQHVISVMANDSVVFKDISQPANKVKSRQWDFNGDGVSDYEGESATLVLEPGFYKVVLCINGTSQCIARCLYVAPLPEPDTTKVEMTVDTLPAPEPEPKPEPVSEKPKKEPKKPRVTQTPAPKPPAPKPPRPDPAPEKPATVVTPKPEKPKPTPAPIKPTAPVDKSAVVTKPATDSPGSGGTPPPPPPRQPGTVGLPLSGHTDGNECLDYKQASFSVTLQSKKWASLQSFRVFTDGCGGVKVSVSGGDLNEQITRSLVKGRNQIGIGDEDILLEPGITYTLTCTAFAPYGGCSDSKTPHFEDATDCGGASAQHAALTLNQSGKLFIYDLKFLY